MQLKFLLLLGNKSQLALHIQEKNTGMQMGMHGLLNTIASYLSLWVDHKSSRKALLILSSH